MIEYVQIGVTLLVFSVGLWITIRHFKIVRTVSYIERMNHSSMVLIRADVDNWLESTDSIEAKLERVRKDSELNTKVTIIYNLLTELAIAHDSRIIDRRMTYKIWFPLVPRYRHRLEFYISDSCTRGKPLGQSLRKFSDLVEAYNRKKGFVLEGEFAPARKLNDDNEKKSNPSLNPTA